MSDISPEQAVQFKAALREQTAGWGENPAAYTADPGSEQAYDQMGDILLDRIIASGVDERFTSPGTHGGMSIVPRFLYAGARMAEIQGLSLDQLHRAMYNHGSFNALSEITREDKHTAKRIEVPLGLKPVGGVSVEYYLHEFQLDEETGLSIPGYRDLWVAARLDALAQQHIQPAEAFERWQIKCPAHLTGILGMAYRSMLTISMEDPHLFQATLARHAAAPVEVIQTA